MNSHTQRNAFQAAIVLWALLTSARADQLHNPIVDTNCYPVSTNVVCALAPYAQFLSVAATNQCVAGAMIVATATYTNVQGTVTRTINYSNDSVCPPLVTNYTVSSAILTNWWDAGCANGSGLTASFSPTNCGGGTVSFYLTYSNPSPCTDTTTITTNITYSVDSNCTHHIAGDEEEPPSLPTCNNFTTNGYPWSTNSLCGDSFSVTCVNGTVHLTGPGGECGVCRFLPSSWRASYTFCRCKAKICATHFGVADTGTNNATYGLLVSSDWGCGHLCTNTCFTVLTWAVDPNGIVYPKTWSDPIPCP
jgi:hypothetical protein